jgi:hypothetical protein
MARGHLALRLQAAVAVMLFALSSRAELATASKPNTVLCRLADSDYVDDKDQTVSEFFECPGHEDPPDHTSCCGERCCRPPVTLDAILRVDIRMAMVISLTVIAACVVAGVVIVLCCFLSTCPLYDTCSGSWGKRERASAQSACDGLVPTYFVPAGYVRAQDGHPHTINRSARRVRNFNHHEKNNHHHLLADGVSENSVKHADHV